MCPERKPTNKVPVLEHCHILAPETSRPVQMPKERADSSVSLREGALNAFNRNSLFDTVCTFGGDIDNRALFDFAACPKAAASHTQRWGRHRWPRGQRAGRLLRLAILLRGQRLCLPMRQEGILAASTAPRMVHQTAGPGHPSPNAPPRAPCLRFACSSNPFCRYLSGAADIRLSLACRLLVFVVEILSSNRCDNEDGATEPMPSVCARLDRYGACAIGVVFFEYVQALNAGQKWKICNPSRADKRPCRAQAHLHSGERRLHAFADALRLLVSSAQMSEPRIATLATPARPASTLRYRRITFGRSGRRRKPGRDLSRGARPYLLTAKMVSATS
jgi:hypothetical protein